MVQNIGPNVVNCPNCGATIQDTLISSIKVCTYCGTKLNAAQGDSDITETLIAKANITADNLSAAIAKWLNEPLYYRLPIDLSYVTIVSSTMIYYPAYIFRGKYKGEWSLKKNENSGGLLDNDFNLTVYACTLDSVMQSGDTEKALSMSLRSNGVMGSDQNLIDIAYLVDTVARAIIPPQDISVFNNNEKPGATLYDFGMDEDAAWKINGKNLLEDCVDADIRRQYENNSIADDEAFIKKYSATMFQKNKIYVPIWEITYTYQDKKYSLVLDATGGWANGDEMILANPEAQTAGWEQILSSWFLMPLWLVWGILRMWWFPEGSILSLANKSSHDFFLSADTTIWYTRQGIILFIAFVVFPMLRKMILEKRIAGQYDDPSGNIDYINGTKTLTFA